MLTCVQDRCHRIGQTKQVTVYKLVTEDSVDEDIFDMGERKRMLSEAVLGANKSTKKGASSGQHAEKDDDMGAIGRILQKALLRVSNKVAGGSTTAASTNSSPNTRMPADVDVSVMAVPEAKLSSARSVVVSDQEVIELL